MGGRRRKRQSSLISVSRSIVEEEQNVTQDAAPPAGGGCDDKDESNSALHLAGYQRRDEFSGKVLSLLPPLDSVRDPNDTENFDPHFPEVNNPLVIRAINEMRKVVNAVIRKYGKPSRIHLEMARDLKMSPHQTTCFHLFASKIIIFGTLG